MSKYKGITVFIVGFVFIIALASCTKTAPQFPQPSFSGNTPSPPENVGQSLAHAQQLLQQNNKADAEKVLLDILSKHPDNLPARNLLGGIYLQTGKPGLALQQYQEMYRISHNPYFLASSCWAYTALKDWGKAEADCESAIRMKPDLLTYHSLGNLYAAEKKNEKAIHAFQQALKSPRYKDLRQDENLREDVRRRLQQLKGH